jgi:hypothetical protein
MRWNPADKWVFSEQIAHPEIISKEDFELAQATLAGRGSRTQHKPHSRPRRYALRSVIFCGLCDRRMSGKWNNDQAYYLCRFPTEYALAKGLHPGLQLRDLRHLDLQRRDDLVLLRQQLPQPYIRGTQPLAGGTQHRDHLVRRFSLTGHTGRIGRSRHPARDGPQ